jgi:membrane protease YdiL (CAAX protease family)
MANPATPTAKTMVAMTTWTGWRESRVALFIVAHPAMQVFAFALLVLIYMWKVEPASGMVPRGLCLLLLASLPLASNLLHRDRASEIGFRLDNLGRSTLEVGGASVAAALLVAAVRLLATRDAPAPNLPSVSAIVTYPFWGLLQQYALQGFVRRRLRAAWGPEAAAAVAAILFGILHAPNPILVPATTLAGYFWCRLHERTPNLITLSFSHAGLALLVLELFPAAWHHGLRVGPGYWSWP